MFGLGLHFPISQGLFAAGGGHGGFIGFRADTTFITADAAGVLADRTSIHVDTNHITTDMAAISADYAR